MQLLRKISTATVYGGKDLLLSLVLGDKERLHPIYRVVGIANGTRMGKSKFDDKPDAQDWRALLGNFEATNLTTGEIFRSGVCFMPAYIVDAVSGQFTGDVETVKFAFDISVKYSDKPSNYEFLGTSLIEPAEDDALSNLAKALPAIEGPGAKAKQLEGKGKGK